MTKEDVLARVHDDLARGHTYPALRRLASLAAQYPDDLDIRAMRGLVNRQIGNPAEAGRWGFLTEDPLDEELAAFARGYPYALARLRALNLRGDPADRLGPRARRRLAELRERAAEEGATPVGGPGRQQRPEIVHGWLDRIGCLAIVLLLCIPAALMAIGLITVLRWLT